MRVLSQRSKPATYRGTGAGWWVGKRMTCRACGARSEVEAGDYVIVPGDLQGDAMVYCPVCRDIGWVRKHWYMRLLLWHG